MIGWVLAMGRIVQARRLLLPPTLSGFTPFPTVCTVPVPREGVFLA